MVIKKVSIKKMFIIEQYRKGHGLSAIVKLYKAKFGSSISRQWIHQVVSQTTEWNDARKQIEEIKPIICQRCGWTWTPKKLGKPKVCPHCFSAYYDSPAKSGNYKRKTDERRMI